MEKGQRCLVVVRVRGVSDIRSDIQDTMKMLNLMHNCNATLIDDRSSYLGMLQKVGSYVTWGEASKGTITLLLRERGNTIGNKRLTDEYAKKVGYESLDRLAEAICSLGVQFKNLSEVKPVFRLHPPKKGFKGSIKKSYKSGGVTGYRGEVINDLVKRMT
jgi:large subunit ribosomal protein L30